MRAALILPALALAAGLGLAPVQGWAANADQPYKNVDKGNDVGNATGNSQVDRLNSGQLDQNQTTSAPPGAAAPSQPAPGTASQR